MQENANELAKRIGEIGPFQLIGEGDETLPLVAFNLAEEKPYDEFDIAFQLSAERGWMVPAYTMPPDAQDVKMMRALVKETLSRALVDTLADDIATRSRRSRRRGACTRPSARWSRPEPGTDERGCRIAEARRAWSWGR